LISYYLKSRAERGEGPRIDILDRNGKVVRALANLPGEPGLNRIAWDLRTDSPAPPGAPQENGAGGGRGGAARGILVPAGEYTVRMSLGPSQMTKKIQVEDDLRVTLTPADRELRTQTITELFNLTKEADSAERQFTALRTSIAGLRETWNRPGAPSVPAAAAKALDELEKKMDAIEKTSAPDLAAGTPLAVYSSPPVSQRLSRLMTAIDNYALKPTDDQLTELKQLRAEMPEVNSKITQLMEEDLPRTNQLISGAGVPFLSISGQSAGRGQRRRQE
jgi:hypothetical protein